MDVDGVLTGLAQLRERVWSCSDDDAVETAVGLTRVVAAARATYLVVLAEAAARDELTTVAAVAGRTVLSRGRVLGDLEQARALGVGGPLPGVGQALTDGSTTAEHAALAVRALASVPVRTVRERAPEIDALLSSHATTFTAPVFRRLARHLLHTLDPDRADRFDPDAHTRREAHLGIDSTGMGQLRAQLDPHATATLKAVLDVLSAPAPGQDGVRDTRTAAQRRADALTEMARAAAGNLPTGDGSGYGDAARVVVHVGNADGTDFASCEQTGPFSTSGLALAACDATTETVTLNPHGRILSMATTAGSSPARSAEPSPPATAAAPSPAATAHPGGHKPTTAPRGRRAAPPTPTTVSCSASPTTPRSTTAPGPSPSATACPGSSPHRTSTLTAPRSATPSTTRSAPPCNSAGPCATTTRAQGDANRTEPRWCAAVRPRRAQ